MDSLAKDLLLASVAGVAGALVSHWLTRSTRQNVSGQNTSDGWESVREAEAAEAAAVGQLDPSSEPGIPLALPRSRRLARRFVREWPRY